MAANTSFKVACPSCEASVPVRDPNLIGRKIDCPKCKYRFVVEDPNGEMDDADDRPVAKSKAGRAGAKAKKKGGNNVLVLGSVLGGIALILLGVCAYFLFIRGEDPKPGPVVRNNPPVLPINTNSTPPTGENTTPPTGEPGAPTPPADVAGGPPVVAATTPAPSQAPPLPPAPGGVYSNITNLIPTTAHQVMNIDMDRMRNCTLGQQAFESRVGFRPDTFKAKLGIGIEEMTRFIRAENLEQKWTFNIIKTKEPVKYADLMSAMNLKKGPKSPIQGRAYYELPPNDLLDHLSVILESELESKEAKDAKEKPKTTGPSSGPLTAMILDPTTVIIANLDVMEEFLTANCQFEQRSRVRGGAGGDAPPGGDPNVVPPPIAGGDGGRPGGGERGGNPDGGGGQRGPEFTDRATYLTIEPALKAMLDRLESGEEPIIASMAQRLQANAKILERLRDTTGFKQLEVRGMNVLGVALHNLQVDRFKGQVIVDWFREADARTLEEELKKVLDAVAQAMGLYLGGIRISVEGGTGGGGGPGFGGPGGGPGGGGPVAGGRPGQVGPRGDQPPPGEDPGVGNPQDPNNQNPGSGPRSTIGLTRQGRLLLFNIDLSLTERAYDKIYALSEGVVIRMKGMVDMSDGQPRWHELVKAANALPKDGIVPRATYSRDDALNSRLGRTFPPNARVSWMAGLLPYLGQDELFNRIEQKKSWRDEQNLKQGAVLIPQFLNPRFPRPTWRAHVPSLGVRDQGATHYVGMAGVGLDAADYRFGDKAVEKKMGIFGYDRRTNLKDVTDGLSNTIYMIQVPPTYPRPWIAGGGATVAGVPEQNSVAPFLSDQGSKRGTYVLMADGTVRYIDKNISEAVFKAMCTIKGGDEVGDVNQEAPKFELPKGTELKTAQANPNVQ